MTTGTETIRARLDQPGAVHAAARYYIGLGLPVFPVRGKIPYPGTRGFKDASLDPAVIDAWWNAWPDAGVAAPTGVLYDVVDIDGPAGFESLEKLIDQAGGFECAFPSVLGEVATMRGWHILIPANGRGNGAADGGFPGIDYRGNGGYTVLPPSKRDGRVAYLWATPPTFAAV